MKNMQHKTQGQSRQRFPGLVANAAIFLALGAVIAYLFTANDGRGGA